VGHRRIDEIPSSIISTAHKPEAIIVEEGDVTIAVATKAWAEGTDPPLRDEAYCSSGLNPSLMLALPLRHFSTILGQRCPTGFGDRESLGGPAIFSDARVIAFHDVSRAAQLVQLSVLTTAGRNGEHQK